MENTEKRDERLDTLQFEMMAVCTEDSLPNFEAEDWVEKGETYKVVRNSGTKDILSGGLCFQIEDRNGNLIIPSQEKSITHFRADRFKFTEHRICLN